MKPWIQRWEYRVLLQEYDKETQTGSVVDLGEDLGENLISALNRLGQEGWELTVCNAVNLPDVVFFNYILERPID